MSLKLTDPNNGTGLGHEELTIKPSTVLVTNEFLNSERDVMTRIGDSDKDTGWRGWGGGGGGGGGRTLRFEKEVMLIEKWQRLLYTTYS